MKQRHYILLVLLIIMLAIFVRGFHLLSSPPSLYWEEAALGYDAYSILKTGRDHHGHFLPIVAFESFGDWKPALYFYLVAATELFWGLTPVAVRLPAMLAGCLTVIAVALMAKLLIFENQKIYQSKLIFILTLLIGAISPWGIMFSRAGWESTVATCFLAWGSVCWLWAKQSKRSWLWLIVGTTLLALSAYTYHSARLIAPLLFGWLLIYYLYPLTLTWSNLLKSIQFNKYKVLMVTAMFALFLLPILSQLTSDQVSNRFNTSSIFADGSIVRESNQLRQAAGYSLVSRLIYHRYVLSAYVVAQNLVSHFSPTFLFISGDSNWRHSTQFFGQLYWLDALLIPIGLLWLWRNKRLSLIFMSGYLLICLLPSSLSTGSPHALRTLPSLPFWWIMAAMGLYALWQWWLTKSQKLSLIIRRGLGLAIILAYLGQFAWFYYSYQTVYPKLAAHEWQFGYFELFRALNAWAQVNPNQTIYVTREQGRPAMYYFFFNQIDPGLVQQVNATTKKDQAEFLNFGRYQFIDDLGQMKPHSIVAASPAKMTTLGDQVKVIGQVKSLDGLVVWQIGQYE